MALTIENITRESPAPCQHFVIQLNDNGQTRTAHISQDDLMLFGELEMDYRLALAMLYARYRLVHGATVLDLIGATVAP